MAEFIRSIVGRLREFVGNRRRAPRYPVRLEAEIALSALVAKTGAQTFFAASARAHHAAILRGNRPSPKNPAFTCPEYLVG